MTTSFSHVPAELTRESVIRYSRQLILPGWSSESQRQLGTTAIAINSSFSSAALYLAAAGVGAIALANDNPLLHEQLGRLRPDLELLSLDCDQPFAASLLSIKQQLTRQAPFRVAVDANHHQLLVNEAPWRSGLQASAVNPTSTLPLLGALLILEQLAAECGAKLSPRTQPPG